MIRCESFSSISTFLQCPLKYKLRYIDRVKSDKVSEALENGKRVHEEIAKGMCRSSASKKAQAFAKKICPKGGKIQEAYQELKIGFDEGFVPQDYALADYYRGRVDFVTVEYLTEKTDKINFESTPRKIKVIDWKTGKSNGNRKQLESYGLYFSIVYETEDVETAFVYVEQVKNSKFVKVKDFQKIRDWISDKINLIREEKLFDPKLTPLCGWCEYEDICPACKGVEVGVHPILAMRAGFKSLLG